jgi:hypothetical protein
MSFLKSSPANKHKKAFTTEFTELHRVNRVQIFGFKQTSLAIFTLCNSVNSVVQSPLRFWGFTAFLTLFLGAFPLLAADNGGLQPAAYLNLGVGGEENAMGGAAVGLGGEAFGAFWNPAQIISVQGTQVALEHTVISLNRTLEALSVIANYQDRYYLGFTALDYSDGNDLEARAEPTLSPDAVFSDMNLAFLGTAAFHLDSQWDFGFNLKIMTQAYGLASLPTGFGIGEDFGVQFRPSPATTFGFVVQDVFSDFLYSDGTDDLFPATLRLGVAQKWLDLQLKADLDLEWQAALGLIPHAGLEWNPVDAIALRAGYWFELNSGQDGFGAGIGILIPAPKQRIEFDYTILPDRLSAGQLLQQLTLSVNFL